MGEGSGTQGTRQSGTNLPLKQSWKTGSGLFLGAIGAARPIPWKTEDPVWVPQWPLSSEKLEAATQLIREQIDLGHIEPYLPSMPRTVISMALFTINFLNLDERGHTAAEHHCSEPDRPKEMVKWKDVLTNKWKGPDPVLLRSRGAVCVFPQDEENPLWVPERLTRTILEQDHDAESKGTIAHPDPDNTEQGLDNNG